MATAPPLCRAQSPPALNPRLVGWLFSDHWTLIICHPPHPGLQGPAGAVQRPVLGVSDLPQDERRGAGQRHPGAGGGARGGAGNPQRADEARGALRPAGRQPKPGLSAGRGRRGRKMSFFWLQLVSCKGIICHFCRLGSLIQNDNRKT